MQEAKIYIGNLDYETKEEDLKKLFQDNGITVKEVVVISDKYTGRSKGFGFVTVESEEAIQEAINKLDNKDFNGRNLRVSKARERRERGDFPSRGPRSERFPKY